jgi:thiol-disulfide isomerase/thioredoxin
VTDSDTGPRARLARGAQLAFAVIAVFFAYAFVATAKDGELRRTCSALCALSPNYAAHARRAPDFEFNDLSGRPVRLSSFRDKVVILNFWSRACPPCLEEMPSLELLAQRLRKRNDVVLLAISTDESTAEAADAIRSLLGESSALQVLVDPGGDEVRRLFGTRLFPETWFIDGDGVVRARIDGARDWASPLALELVDSLQLELSCPIEFQRGEPAGGAATLCAELGR